MITLKQKKELSSVVRQYAIMAAYVFGSQALGTQSATSDVDIAVLFDKKIDKKKRFAARLLLNQKFQKICRQPVDVVIINDVSSVFFRYVIVREGVLLYEKNEATRIDFEQKTLSEYFDFEPFLMEYNAHYVKNSVQQNSRKTRSSR